MFSQFARSSLGLGLPGPLLICGDPTYQDRVVVVSPTAHRGLILDTSADEPELAEGFVLPSNHLQQQQRTVVDVSWGSDGRVYMLFRARAGDAAAAAGDLGNDGAHADLDDDPDQDDEEEAMTWTVDVFAVTPAWTLVKSLHDRDVRTISSFACQRNGSLLLGTVNGHLLHKLDVLSSSSTLVDLGRVFPSNTTRGNSSEENRSSSSEELSILVVKRDRLVAAVSKSGRLCLALTTSSNGQVAHTIELPGPPPPASSKVSAVAFCQESQVLAVGFAQGPPRVRLFEYGWDSQHIRALAIRDLAVFGASRIEEERWLGGVIDLEFGRGFSLACIFEGRCEPIVFHTLTGRRTTTGGGGGGSMYPSPPYTNGNSKAARAKNPPPTSATKRNRLLCFQQYSLFFTAAPPSIGNNSSNPASDLLFCESFARHGPQVSLRRNDASRFSLLGCDYLCMLNLEGHPRWSRVMCPPDYVARQGPMLNIAMDADRSRIAVSGAHGLCVFFAQSRRWKTIQSESLENGLVVGGMFWLPSSPCLCVVALHPSAAGETGAAPHQTDPGYKWEFRVFDVGDQRLGSAPVFVSQTYSGALPVAVDFFTPSTTPDTDGIVVLLGVGVEIFTFSRNLHNNNNSRNGGRSEMRSVGFVARPKELGLLVHIVVVPSKLASVLPRCVLMDASGRCGVLNLETSECTMLTPQQPAMWPTTFRVGDAWSKMDPIVGNIIYAVVDDGLKLWIPSLDPDGDFFRTVGTESTTAATTTTTTTGSTHTAPTSLPDVFLADTGSLPVGSDEDAFVSIEAHSHDVRASKGPILYGLLGWLLRRDRQGLARRVLAERRFSKSTRLVRAALEDLLQGALLGENRVEVKHVLNLLGCVPFDMLAAVVTRCARQIDPALWDVLFSDSMVGAPRDLFEQCVTRFDSSSMEDESAGIRQELLLIASELLPIVDSDANDPPDGPIVRAKRILQRCERGGALEEDVMEYARKRGLSIPVDYHQASWKQQQQREPGQGEGEVGEEEVEGEDTKQQQHGMVGGLLAYLFTGY